MTGLAWITGLVVLGWCLMLAWDGVPMWCRRCDRHPDVCTCAAEPAAGQLRAAA